MYEKLVEKELVKTFPYFIEPEGSLPCSHKAASLSYSDPY
jgi:hypothetical protein